MKKRKCLEYRETCLLMGYQFGKDSGKIIILWWEILEIRWVISNELEELVNMYIWDLKGNLEKKRIEYSHIWRDGLSKPKTMEKSDICEEYYWSMKMDMCNTWWVFIPRSYVPRNSFICLTFEFWLTLTYL